MHFCKRKRIGSTLVAKWHVQKVQKDHDHLGQMHCVAVSSNEIHIIYYIIYFFWIDLTIANFSIK